MEGGVVYATWSCNEQVEVIAIPWGIGARRGDKVIVWGEVEEREGGDVEEVGTVWGTLRYSSGGGEGGSSVVKDFDADGTVLKEAG